MSSSPAFFWTPPDTSFAVADAAAEIAASLGFMVDEPEREALRVLLGQRPDGRWATLEAGIVCGRQNIKTWAVQMAVLTECLVRPQAKRIVWSAHLYKTTQDTFNEFITLIERNPWLDTEVKKVSRGNGEEGIVWKSGLQLDFVARSVKAARGLAGDTVVFDEALFLTPQMLGALLPTLSSRPNPHAIYASSPGLTTSEQLRRIRDRGRAMNDPSLSYIEWTSKREPCEKDGCDHRFGSKGCVLDDETKWDEANPALGRRIPLEYVRSERRALEPGEFMRERLGWHEDPSAEGEDSAIPVDLWADCADVTSTLEGNAEYAFGVDRSWDRRTTWVAAAGRRADGRIHVELAANGANDAWAAAWLADRVPYDELLGVGFQAERAPISTLGENFDHVKARKLNTAELGRACGSLYDLVKDGVIVHAGQEQLDLAVLASRARPLGDAWVFDRKGTSYDTAPLMAVAAAVHVLLTVPRKVTPTFYDFNDL